MGRYVLLVAVLVSLTIGAVLVNVLIIPGMNSVQTSIDEINTPRTGTTNTTGNTTGTFDVSEVGLLGDPRGQLLQTLVIIGIAAAVTAVLVFGAGVQPGPAAVAAFVSVMAITVVYTLLGFENVFGLIPDPYGNAIFTIVAAISVSAILWTAASIMSGSGGD